MEQRFEVWVDGDNFIVVDSFTDKQVGKSYKYSRYACNLQGELEFSYQKTIN